VSFARLVEREDEKEAVAENDTPGRPPDGEDGA